MAFIDRKRNSLPPWSQLPAEILELIALRLDTVTDQLRFRSVCSSWRSASILASPRRFPSQLPWLLLPHNPNTANVSFFSLSTRAVHSVHLPVADGKWFCGSSHGWLLMLDRSPTASLLNPITKNQIPLPPITTLPHIKAFESAKRGMEYIVYKDGRISVASSEHVRYNTIRKAILSSDPATDPNTVVLAVLHGFPPNLAFCRIGDGSWSLLDLPSSLGTIGDVTYFNGNFYAFGLEGRFAICDLGTKREAKLIPSLEIHDGDKNHLVGSSTGEQLLLIAHDYLGGYEPCEGNITERFNAFRLDLGAKKGAEVKSLGDGMLFVGRNDNFILPARDFSGRKGDCIYFVDDYFLDEEGFWGSNCVGIYHLDDGQIEWLGYNLDVCPLLHCSRAMWFMPSLG
ncbi:F-box protein SKIP23-like [Typha angustifolia]|uniref:F-box protein SKIP23-like n=1 Tax=Typha angustifolia TaxID=59011 RepID=UPI003C2B7B3E